MWISKNIAEDPDNRAASAGSVGNSANLRISANSADGSGQCAMVTPPGIYSLPMRNQDAVVLQTKNGPVCVGLRMGMFRGEIEPGEIVLRSYGGAEIKLDNEGKVWINGVEVGNGYITE